MCPVATAIATRLSLVGRTHLQTRPVFSALQPVHSGCRPNCTTCPQVLYLVPLYRAVPGLYNFSSLFTITIPFPHLLPYIPNKPVIYYRLLSLIPSKLLYVCPRVPPKTVPISIPFSLLFLLLYNYIVNSLGIERLRALIIIRYRYRNPY